MLLKGWDDIDPGIDPDFEIPEFSKQVDFVYSHLKHKEDKQ